MLFLSQSCLRASAREGRQIGSPKFIDVIFDIFKHIQVAFLVFKKLLKELLGDLVFTFFNPILTNLVTDMREVKG